MMIKVEVWNGLKERPVDVVVAPIDPDPGELGWNSKLDRALKKLSGTLYYRKLMAYAIQGKLRLGTVFLVKGWRGNHDGTFNHVMFYPLIHGFRAKTLYRALAFAHNNGMKDILVPLAPHWLDSPFYYGVGRESTGQSLEIIKMSLALVEEEIEDVDLTVNFAPCSDKTWSRRLISELREEYVLDSKKESLWVSVKELFGQT